jgi:hypothetical protein
MFGRLRHRLSTIVSRPFSSSSIVADKRPFKILGIQQIAVGGLNKSNLEKFWVGTLGIPKVGTFRSEKENVDEDILKCVSIY